MLALIPSIVLAEETVRAIFGIAPSQQSICVAPGYNATVLWMFSSTSPIEEVITAQSNLGWVKIDSPIVIKPEGQTTIVTVVAPPIETKEGKFEGQLVMCSNMTPIQGQLGVQTCLIPAIDISVNRTCAPGPATKATGQPLLLIAAVGLVLVLSVGLILRRR